MPTGLFQAPASLLPMSSSPRVYDVPHVLRNTSLEHIVDSFRSEAFAFGYAVEEVRLCPPSVSVTDIPRIVFSSPSNAQELNSPRDFNCVTNKPRGLEHPTGNQYVPMPSNFCRSMNGTRGAVNCSPSAPLDLTTFKQPVVVPRYFPDLIPANHSSSSWPSHPQAHSCERKDDDHKSKNGVKSMRKEANNNSLVHNNNDNIMKQRNKLKDNNNLENCKNYNNNSNNNNVSTVSPFINRPKNNEGLFPGKSSSSLKDKWSQSVLQERSKALTSPLNSIMNSENKMEKKKHTGADIIRSLKDDRAATSLKALVRMNSKTNLDAKRKSIKRMNGKENIMKDWDVDTNLTTCRSSASGLDLCKEREGEKRDVVIFKDSESDEYLNNNNNNNDNTNEVQERSKNKALTLKLTIGHEQLENMSMQTKLKEIAHECNTKVDYFDQHQQPIQQSQQPIQLEKKQRQQLFFQQNKQKKNGSVKVVNCSENGSDRMNMLNSNQVIKIAPENGSSNDKICAQNTSSMETKSNDEEVEEEKSNIIPDSHVRLFLSSVATITAREQASAVKAAKQAPFKNENGDVANNNGEIQNDKHQQMKIDEVPVPGYEERKPKLTTEHDEKHNKNDDVLVITSIPNHITTGTEDDVILPPSPTDMHYVKDSNSNNSKNNNSNNHQVICTSNIGSETNQSSRNQHPLKARIKFNNNHRSKIPPQVLLPSASSKSSVARTRSCIDKKFKKASKASKASKAHTLEPAASRSARPFKCSQCSSSFDRDGHLRVHILAVHEKKRPFVCHACNASFGHSSSLLRHVRTVHHASPPVGARHTTKSRSTGGRNSGAGKPNACSSSARKARKVTQVTSPEQVNYRVKSESVECFRDIHSFQESGHEEDDRHFRCSACSETFSRVALLNRHVAEMHSLGEFYDEKADDEDDNMDDNMDEDEYELNER